MCLECVMIPCVCALTFLTGRLDQLRKKEVREEVPSPQQEEFKFHLVNPRSFSIPYLKEESKIFYYVYYSKQGLRRTWELRQCTN